jgi:hypothetical protein
VAKLLCGFDVDELSCREDDVSLFEAEEAIDDNLIGVAVFERV